MSPIFLKVSRWMANQQPTEEANGNPKGPNENGSKTSVDFIK